MVARAEESGLGAPVQVSDNMARALPPGSVTWKVPSLDGELYLFGYGEMPLRCGAVVVRPAPELGFSKVVDLLKGAGQDFVFETSQVLAGDMMWARLRSPKNEFVDLMEYPPSGEQPGVLRADFLPN